MKKILLVILIIICVALLFFLGLRLLFPGTSEEVTENIKEFLPFGSGDDINIPPIGSGDNEDEELPLVDENGEPVADLFKISGTPVAGAVAFSRGTSTVVRYVERATGHIYDVNPLTLEKRKITNTTMPKIYEAHFSQAGNAVLYRSLAADDETVSNTVLMLTPPATTTNPLYTISATVLRGDVNDVTVSGSNLYYSLEDSNSIVSSTFTGANLRTLFTSQFTDWRLAPYGNNLIVYTKATAHSPGYAYTLGSNGVLTRVLGPLTALTVLPNPSGTEILYSHAEGAGYKLFSRNSSTRASVEVLPATFAEKCVWSTEERAVVYCAVPTSGIVGREPDNWYRGITHFSDRIWKFRVDTEVAEVLVEPEKTYKVNIDAMNLSLSPNEDYLLFTNRNDLSLWALKLN